MIKEAWERTQTYRTCVFFNKFLIILFSLFQFAFCQKIQVIQAIFRLYTFILPLDYIAFLD